MAALEAGAARQQRVQGPGAAQARAPVEQLLQAAPAAQPGVLPRPVVGQLQRGRGRVAGRLALAQRGVGRGQLPRDDRRRPAVDDGVMGRQREHVVGLVERDHVRAQQRVAAEVERPVRLLPHQPHGLGLAAGGVQARALPHRDADLVRAAHDLDQVLAVGPEPGAQRLVPAHDVLDARDQRRHGQPALQPHRHPHVGGRVRRVALLHLPGAPLGRGGRRRRGPGRPGRERRRLAGGPQHLQERPLLLGERADSRLQGVRPTHG